MPTYIPYAIKSLELCDQRILQRNMNSTDKFKKYKSIVYV